MNSKPPFIAQERPDTCMLACLRMVLAWQGKQVTEAALLHELALVDGGLDPDQLVRLAEGHGLHAAAQQLDLAGIHALVAQEHYPIVLIDRTVLDREFTIHAVIPVRFTRHYVTVLDPLRGERRLSLRKFEAALRRVGWTVVWESQ